MEGRVVLTFNQSFFSSPFDSDSTFLGHREALCSREKVLITNGLSFKNTKVFGNINESRIQMSSERFFISSLLIS